MDRYDVSEKETGALVASIMARNEERAVELCLGMSPAVMVAEKHVWTVEDLLGFASNLAGTIDMREYADKAPEELAESVVEGNEEACVEGEDGQTYPTGSDRKYIVLHLTMMIEKTREAK